jgi:hypothetical protein
MIPHMQRITSNHQLTRLEHPPPHPPHRRFSLQSVLPRGSKRVSSSFREFGFFQPLQSTRDQGSCFLTMNPAGCSVPTCKAKPMCSRGRAVTRSRGKTRRALQEQRRCLAALPPSRDTVICSLLCVSSAGCRSRLSLPPPFTLHHLCPYTAYPPLNPPLHRKLTF